MLKIIPILFLLFTTSTYSLTKYVIEADREVVCKSFDIITKQVGNIEKKSNWGHPFQDYLASVGIYFPAPYCMSGIYYCYSEASKITGLRNPLMRTGGVLKQWNYFISSGEKVEALPEKYDLLFWQNYARMNGKLKAKTTGHIEIIEKVGKKGWVETIGFNTSSGLSGSQRDGGGVHRRNRHLYNPISLLFTKGLGGYKYKDLQGRAVVSSSAS